MCITCGCFLLAQHGYYLHPDIPCNGIKDYIRIEATIEDDFMHKKFLELYGKPEMDDGLRITVLEAHKALLITAIKKRDMQIHIMKKVLNLRLVRFIFSVFRIKVERK